MEEMDVIKTYGLEKDFQNVLSVVISNRKLFDVCNDSYQVIVPLITVNCLKTVEVFPYGVKLGLHYEIAAHLLK